jgi:hypothetical protein
MLGMRRWFVLVVAGMTTMAGVLAPQASAGLTPIGRLGDTLHVEYMTIVADVTVNSVGPSEVPPGFGFAPRGPAFKVESANITVHVIKAPNPFITSIVFNFRGVNPIADAYDSRNSDAPDALQYALQNAPPGSTVTGNVWWDTYRDPITNVMLLDKVTGTHLAQWNL